MEGPRSTGCGGGWGTDGPGASCRHAWLGVQLDMAACAAAASHADTTTAAVIQLLTSCIHDCVTRLTCRSPAARRRCRATESGCQRVTQVLERCWCWATRAPAGRAPARRFGGRDFAEFVSDTRVLPTPFVGTKTVRAGVQRPLAPLHWDICPGTPSMQCCVHASRTTALLAWRLQATPIRSRRLFFRPGSSRGCLPGLHRSNFALHLHWHNRGTE